MSDLRQKYEELVQIREQLNQKHLESRAAHNAAKQREQELAAEANALGVESLSQLDSSIANLEQEIAAELAEIERQLSDLDNVQPSQPTLAEVHKEKMDTMSIDDLLETAGEPTRRNK